MVPDEDGDDDDLIDGGMRKFKFSFKKLWAFTGPGARTCARAAVVIARRTADVHCVHRPRKYRERLAGAGMRAGGSPLVCAQAGAVGIYKVLWVLFWSTVLGWFLQGLSVRLAMTTGRNLAQVCHDEVCLWRAARTHAVRSTPRPRASRCGS